MNLLLQAVSNTGACILFDDMRNIIAQTDISLVWKESASLLKLIKNFLEKFDLDFSQISELVVVNGPGSFTWIRSVVLIVNTLAFVFPNITLSALSYFDLFDHYPILKQSSKRDVFVCFSWDRDIEILLNEICIKKLVELWTKKAFWEVSFDLGWIFLENTPDYATICKRIVFEQKKRLDPLYIKSPNIS